MGGGGRRRTTWAKTAPTWGGFRGMISKGFVEVVVGEVAVGEVVVGEVMGEVVMDSTVSAERELYNFTPTSPHHSFAITAVLLTSLAGCCHQQVCHGSSCWAARSAHPARILIALGIWIDSQFGNQIAQTEA